MGLRSEFTKVTLELLDEVQAFREEVRKGAAPPYMEERVSGEKFRRRWPLIDLQGRMKIIGKLGTERTLRLLKPKGGRDAPTA